MTAGRSLLEILWEELDSIVDSLMSKGSPSTWYDEVGRECVSVDHFRTYGKDEELISDDPSEFQQWAEWRGQAQGVAYAIAVITSPYAPNVPAIREEAMQRWEANG